MTFSQEGFVPDPTTSSSMKSETNRSGTEDGGSRRDQGNQRKNHGNNHQGCIPRTFKSAG
eukprot:9897591-Ditylum_brightwellii.AAC.1